MSRTYIWFLIVRHIVNVVFLKKCRVDDPWSFGNDLIHPTTMPDGFAAFYVIHNTLEFIKFNLFIGVHANEEVHVRKRQLSLT